jgi:molybdopterin converting factor small subunit
MAFLVKGEVTVQINARVDEATDEDAREKFRDEVQDVIEGLQSDGPDCKLEVQGLQVRVMRSVEEEE